MNIYDKLKSRKIPLTFLCLLLFFTLFFALLFYNTKKALTVFYLKNEIPEQKGLSASYIVNGKESKQIDPEIFFKSENSLLFSRTKDFSIRWNGILKVEKSRFYKIGTTSDDDSSLSIDGELLVDNLGSHPLIKKDEKIFLVKGFHTLELFYRQRGGEAYMELFWSWHKKPRSFIPKDNLIPVAIDARMKSAISQFKDDIAELKLLFCFFSLLSLLCLIYLCFYSKLKVYSKELAICLFSFFVITVFIDVIPGIHLDECWRFYSVKKIAKGIHSLNGMNSYSGSLYQYLLWPFFEFLGYKVLVLRMVSASFNVLALFLAMRLIKIFFPEDKSNYLWLGLLLGTFPAFVTCSRFAIENTTLNLLLTFLGLFYLVKAVQALTVKGEVFYAFFSGLFLGIAAYNHIIAVTVPFSLFLSLLIIYRKDFFSRKVVLFMNMLGLVIGISPRIYGMLIGIGNAASQSKLNTVKSLNWLADLNYLPQLLCSLWDGSILYLRFCGEIILPVFPYISVALLFLFISACFISKKDLLNKKIFLLLLFPLLATVLKTVITPSLCLRYFFIGLTAVPFYLVCFSAPLRAHSKRVFQVTGRGILILIICLNCMYLSINYFYSFGKNGGRSSFFNLGERLTETSNHFMRSDRLYKQLLKKGVSQVIGSNFIVFPLGSYDLEKQYLDLKIQSETELPVLTEKDLFKKTALVFFNGNLREGFANIFKAKERKSFSHNSIYYRFDPSFDQNFTVFILEYKEKDK